MKNSIAIVGRTNVGKSLLFNKLTRARKSLVIDYHGVTRDINSGYLLLGNRSLYIEDTGGIPEENDKFSSQILEKASFIDTIDFIDLLDNKALAPIMSTQLKSEASSPAVGIDNLIFVKLDDGDTSAINIEDNNLEWNYKGRNVPLSIKGSGAIAYQNNNIYVPRDDGNIISLVASSLRHIF